MRIAILGATSQIAKDLILSMAHTSEHQLLLFARRPEAVNEWLASVGLAAHYPVHDFSVVSQQALDVIINFVGVGNPAQSVALGSSIFDITLKYDELAMAYVQEHPECRYLFLSSGAAYGSCFDTPVSRDTPAVIPFNQLSPQDWYGVAKLHAECRHRAHSEWAITDIRVFNYFSSTQDITQRFLMTDILRAIREGNVLKTSPDYIVRDYLHPADFYQLVQVLLAAPPVNTVVDCYSLAPIDKPNLLYAMQARFGLNYETTTTAASVNATGNKPYYYSLNTHAADFGYQPTLTALEAVLQESLKILSQ
jgi:nucleoside-diphosphate-sugar epimerase